MSEQPASKDQISAERLSDLIASCIFQSETGGHGDGYVAFLYDIACACMELQRRRAAHEPPAQTSKESCIPPLPKPDGYDRRVDGHYSATSMLEFAALAAINARRGSQDRIEALNKKLSAALQDLQEERLVSASLQQQAEKLVELRDRDRDRAAHEPKSNPGGTGLEQSPSGCGDGHGDSGLTPGGAGGGRASGIPILREALEEACRECACTVRERDSGHRVECSVPRWREILDSTTPPPSADATDAARYRWLRGHVAPSVLERITSTPKSLIADKRSEALDAEIDLRRAGKIGAGSGPTKQADDLLAAVRWICPKCTTVNGIDDAKCLSCRQARPSLGEGSAQ